MHANPTEQRLSECGIRPTAQRVQIALLLLAAPQHLSAEQILASLRSAGARVSKATVYNTLNLFAARGLIRQLSVDGSRAWFDSNVDAHYHFHDVASGALIDVPVPEVEFSKLPAPPPVPVWRNTLALTWSATTFESRRTSETVDSSTSSAPFYVQS